MFSFGLLQSRETNTGFFKPLYILQSLIYLLKPAVTPAPAVQLNICKQPNDATLSKSTNTPNRQTDLGPVKVMLVFSGYNPGYNLPQLPGELASSFKTQQ